jgi:hypothetical protein
MAKNEIQKRVRKIRSRFTIAQTNISSWVALLPNIQQADQFLKVVEDSIDNAPEILNNYTNDEVIEHLDMVDNATLFLNSIPATDFNYEQPLNVAGTATGSSYKDYIKYVDTKFKNQPGVPEWVAESYIAFENLDVIQKRSEIVRKRLTQLHPSLGELHEKAVDAYHLAKVRPLSTVEASQTMDILLNQFKGNLIAKCRRGEKATYKRISDNLAVDSELTKYVVSNGQEKYDSIKKELTLLIYVPSAIIGVCLN